MDTKQAGMGMGNRGVARPMMGNAPEEEKEKGMDRMAMLQKHHKKTLWVYWMVILLGIWLVVSPATFGYGQDVVRPSGGRTLWLSDALRVHVAIWNDVVCGILLIVLGWRCLTVNRPISRWLACAVAIWLNMAPVIFWAPSAVIYMNDTLVGVMVIAFTILIPGMPNMITYMKMGSEVPPGWSYNPSSWPQRWVMMVLGFLGWLVSRYLATYQLGYTPTVWDPFFGEASLKVLNSDMSHSLPISDGALGALAYTFEFLMGWMGSPTRWRTMPWMVTFFGILVIPLGLVHIFLVISQPVVVGHWCFFCLMAAAIMLPMIPLEFDEVIAMGQHLVQAKKRGDNLWNVFWKGGKPFEQNKDQRNVPLVKLPQRPMAVFRASVWGMTVPWNLAVATLMGLACLFAPAIMGVDIGTTTAHIFHLCGALIVVISVISMGEIVRTGRFLNLLPALVLVAGPWWVAQTNMQVCMVGTGLGIVALITSLPKGPISEHYGLWDRYIR